MKPEPKRPDWKETRGTYQRRKIDELKTTSVGDALPSSLGRLGWLEDRDAQLSKLLNALQSLGVPMGASDWANRAVLLIERMSNRERAAKMFIASDRCQEAMERFMHTFDHHRKMYYKHLPRLTQECCWCGWAGAARLIGNGNAACYDCLPE